MQCGNSILTEWCFRVRYFLPRTKRHLFLRQPVPRKNANRSWSTNPPVRPEPIPILTFQPTDSAEEPKSYSSELLILGYGLRPFVILCIMNFFVESD